MFVCVRVGMCILAGMVVVMGGGVERRGGRWSEQDSARLHPSALPRTEKRAGHTHHAQIALFRQLSLFWQPVGARDRFAWPAVQYGGAKKDAAGSIRRGTDGDGGGGGGGGREGKGRGGEGLWDILTPQT